MNRYIFSVIILIFVFLHSGQAEQCHFYDQSQLSSSLITKIIQDKDGFIWIGTENGLNKFDGWRFTHYLSDSKDTTSLSGNSIEALFTDKDSLLWIATNKGLQYYDSYSNTFQSIIFPKGILPCVKDITQLHTGEIWIVTAGYGVFSIDKSNLKAISLPEINAKLTSQHASKIYQDRGHQIWIPMINNQMACISKDRQNVNLHNLPISSYHGVYGMIEDELGRMFIVTSANVFLWDNIKQKYLLVDNEDPESNFFRGFTKLKDGSIYIYTIGQGIKYVDPNSLSLKTPSYLPNRHKNPKDERIRAFYEDKSGNFWLGYYRKGLLMKPNQPMYFQFWDVLSAIEQEAHFTAVISDNNLWVGSDNGKLFKFSDSGDIGASWQLPINISCMLEDQKETFWIGSYSNGLGLFNSQTNEYKNIPEFENKFIPTIEKDKNNNLYVAEHGQGFTRYNPSTGELTHISTALILENSSHLSSNWINHILCDSDGLIWLAQSTGVDCYNPDKHIFIDFPGKENLQPYTANTIMEDDKKNIWIGTINGLFCYSKKDSSHQYYGVSDGLPNNIIYGLGKDSKGNIWGSTQNGLFQLNIEDRRIANYFSGNGLVDKEYHKGVSLQDEDGFIYFSSMHGITRFMPDSVLPLQFNSKPKLTQLYINNTSVSSKTKIQNKPIAEKNLIDASKIHLSHKEKTFSLEFSTMNFHHKENIQFEYRLLGINEEWNKTFPGENRITYNSLSPGNYVLEIRAFENNTYTPTKKLSIQITPPWYATIWAILFYAFLLIGLITLGIKKWYQHKIKIQKEKYNKEKLKFFINIAHEIRSPITLILSPLHELSKKEYDKDTTNLLHTIQRNTDRIKNLINQLLDFQKADKGQMKICYQETDLVSFIKKLLCVFEHQAKKKNIHLSLKTDLNQLPVWIDQNNLDKVLMNLLVNAFKFTPDGGEILITLSKIEKNTIKKTSSFAEIQILDTGIGLNKKDTELIFERFYQDPQQSSLGFGIGLSLAKMLVELHHGTIKAANRQDVQGSCFTIRLPLGNKHFADENIIQEKDIKRIALEPPAHWEIKDNEVGTGKNISRKNILVVDDDDEICKYLHQKLKHNYKIIIANNGKEALHILLRQRIDLVISDVMMPIMDGFTLLKEIKNNINISHVPVILLTSKTEYQTRMKGWDVGADGFMDKPFQIDELLLLCDNLISNRNLLKGKFAGMKQLEDKVNPLTIESNDEQFINRLMERINQNLQDPKYSVEMLARDIGISRSHLHRKLKELTGITTSDFIRNMRLKQAAKLLLEQKTNISQVAYSTGFTNPTTFTIAFKKLYGCTPTEYIKREVD